MQDYKDPEFWRICLLTQIREFEKDIRDGNLEHAAKEMVDVLSVALDALQLCFPEKSIYGHIQDRAAANKDKQIYARDRKFYEEKLRHLENELGILYYDPDMYMKLDSAEEMVRDAYEDREY
jgi:hypothetical protein